MLALVKTQRGAGNVSLLDVPEPEPGPGQVKIRVEVAGICGSDLHFWRGDGIQSMLNPPVTLGHEFSGIIEALGPDVDQWSVGDYVTSEPPAITCQVCEYCRKGQPALCPHRRSLGSGVDGVFTRYVNATERFLHKIPENIDVVSSALSEPTAVCVHAAAQQSQIVAGDVVIVTGPGPIGLLMIQVAKAHGATVILVGTTEDDNRLELGRSLGADMTMVARQDNIEASINGLTLGIGADVAYECSGAQAATNLCLTVLKKRGQFVQLGIFNQSIQVDFNLITTKEITATGSFGSTCTDWDRAHALISQGVVRTKPLVNCDMALDRWQEAFSLLESKQACKAVLRPV
jgi:L-iditol 2-dehydrogenase